MRKSLITATAARIMILTFFAAVIAAGHLAANTSRDIGDPPALDERGINNWILFYTNIERVNRGLLPLAADTLLDKAALWQASWCSRRGNLAHIVDDNQAMRTPLDRVAHFGGATEAIGENVIVEFYANITNRQFYIRKDERGEYRDFGDYEVHWRDERELALTMVNAWMNSPHHRDNIMNKIFNAMGAGVARGTYSGELACYGCQVFSGARPVDFQALQAVRLRGTTDAYLLTYPGEFEVRAVTLDAAKKTIAVDMQKEYASYRVKRPAGNAPLYACLYDGTTGILYPVRLMR